jgi:hypothetical protein
MLRIPHANSDAASGGLLDDRFYTCTTKFGTAGKKKLM